MSQAKNQPAAPNDLRQRQGILHRGGQWLVADHMNAGLQKRFRRLEMNMIGCDDRDGINAVRPLGFGRGHFGETPVSTFRRDMQIKCSGSAARRIGRQSRRNQLKAIIEPSRHAVHRSNESARSASDHA